MEQQSRCLGMTAGQTWRREFLDEMEKVVPWADLVAPGCRHICRKAWPPSVFARDHAAVCLERPSDGRSASRHARVQRMLWTPEMKRCRNGQQWQFGMKSHIGVEVMSGLVRTLNCASDTLNNVIEAYLALSISSSFLTSSKLNLSMRCIAGGFST